MTEEETEEEFETCIECGREIKGTLVRPQTDAYHYKCVDIEYPVEDCYTDNVLENLTVEGTGDETIRLFRFFQENPYDALEQADDPIESIPAVYVRYHPNLDWKSRLLRIARAVVPQRFFSSDHPLGPVENQFNIAPWLAQAVYFGCALEREFPTGVEEDELYPRDEARLPPEEDGEEAAGHSSQGES